VGIPGTAASPVPQVTVGLVAILDSPVRADTADTRGCRDIQVLQGTVGILGQVFQDTRASVVLQGILDLLGTLDLVVHRDTAVIPDSLVGQAGQAIQDILGRGLQGIVDTQDSPVLQDTQDSPVLQVIQDIRARQDGVGIQATRGVG
jgi:hypothetical protein